jgi:hypothetical protein
MQSRLRVDHSPQHLTNAFAADDRFPRPRHEAGLRFVPRVRMTSRMTSTSAGEPCTLDLTGCICFDIP